MKKINIDQLPEISTEAVLSNGETLLMFWYTRGPWVWRKTETAGERRRRLRLLDVFLYWLGVVLHAAEVGATIWEYNKSWRLP